MALIGTVDPYVPNTSFSNYVEHFEYFFSANTAGAVRKIHQNPVGITF